MMGAVSITRANGQIPGYMPLAPIIDSCYVVYAEKIAFAHFFISLGNGWYQSKQVPCVFRADGWEHGYDDDDVAHTPLMCRRKFLW